MASSQHCPGDTQSPQGTPARRDPGCRTGPRCTKFDSPLHQSSRQGRNSRQCTHRHPSANSRRRRGCSKIRHCTDQWAPSDETPDNKNRLDTLAERSYSWRRKYSPVNTTSGSLASHRDNTNRAGREWVAQLAWGKTSQLGTQSARRSMTLMDNSGRPSTRLLCLLTSPRRSKSPGSRRSVRHWTTSLDSSSPRCKYPACPLTSRPGSNSPLNRRSVCGYPRRNRYLQGRETVWHSSTHPDSSNLHHTRRLDRPLRSLPSSRCPRNINRWVR
jgi:hypothetical protein